MLLTITLALVHCFGAVNPLLLIAVTANGVVVEKVETNYPWGGQYKQEQRVWLDTPPPPHGHTVGFVGFLTQQPCCGDYDDPLKKTYYIWQIKAVSICHTPFTTPVVAASALKTFDQL